MMTNAKAAIALLDEWLADDTGYDEKTWPVIQEAVFAYDVHAAGTTVTVPPLMTAPLEKENDHE